MRWVYRGTDGGRRLRNVVRVLDRVVRVTGVPCAVIDDRVYLDGRLAERTIDWYTQSASGTVWYFGERTAALDRRGRVTTREGSWRAGVDGARAGIFMPAHPRVGQSFVQERYAGHAETARRAIRLINPKRGHRPLEGMRGRPSLGGGRSSLRTGPACGTTS